MKFEKAIQNMIETKENDMLGITVENEEELTKVIEALENKGYAIGDVYRIRNAFGFPIVVYLNHVKEIQGSKGAVQPDSKDPWFKNLEDYEPISLKEKYLKQGRVIKYRCGTIGIVVGERILVKEGFNPVGYLDNNLKDCTTEDYDVISVGETKAFSFEKALDEEEIEWLWKSEININKLNDGTTVKYMSNEEEKLGEIVSFTNGEGKVIKGILREDDGVILLKNFTIVEVL